MLFLWIASYSTWFFLPKQNRIRYHQTQVTLWHEGVNQGTAGHTSHWSWSRGNRNYCLYSKDSTVRVFHTGTFLPSLPPSFDHTVRGWRIDWLLWRVHKICRKWWYGKSLRYCYGDWRDNTVVERSGHFWCSESQDFKRFENLFADRTWPVSELLGHLNTDCEAEG